MKYDLFIFFTDSLRALFFSYKNIAHSFNSNVKKRMFRMIRKVLFRRLNSWEVYYSLVQYKKGCQIWQPLLLHGYNWNLIKEITYSKLKLPAIGCIVICIKSFIYKYFCVCSINFNSVVI
jgi:hypothetical protein